VIFTHGRGDYATASGRSGNPPGSPPRAWGLRSMGRGRGRGSRFTPTGVGTTAAYGDGKFCVLGSPPRAWGLRRREGIHLQSLRFTPTGVGTTFTGKQNLLAYSVHPHGRGDYGRATRGDGSNCGSPPRAWGLRRRSSARDTPMSVHPHGRGDYYLPVEAWAESLGSPPRAWGLLRAAGRKEPRARFTPTGVGTTEKTCVLSSNPAVHPHGRGDYVCYERRVFIPFRFTPTGVGTTKQRKHVIKVSSVHPHGRGDYGHNATKPDCLDGSPPRAWGLQVRHHLANAPLRFTPTGVGTTGSVRARLHDVSVHPHGRGDYFLLFRKASAASGSPPRAWGLRETWNAQKFCTRFTPTGVGTTNPW